MPELTGWQFTAFERARSASSVLSLFPSWNDSGGKECTTPLGARWKAIPNHSGRPGHSMSFVWEKPNQNRPGVKSSLQKTCAQGPHSIRHYAHPESAATWQRSWVMYSVTFEAPVYTNEESNLNPTAKKSWASS